VADGKLLETGLEFARSVATKSSLAVANAKYVMNTVWRESLGQTVGLALERERNCLYCLTAEDAAEGLLAFTEKRAPKYRGR